MGRSGEAARGALIEQAERLFAERGIEAVSLRDVSGAAGQRNHSAAQYHFGDRQGLVAAVFRNRMTEVNRRRHERLDALVAEGRERDLAALVEAAVVPLVEVVGETEGWYARFLARTRWDTLALAVLEDLPELTSFRTAFLRIVALLDDLPGELRRSRADQMVTLLVGSVAGWEWARHRGDERLAQDALIDDLVATTVGLLRAPSVAKATSSRRS
jgi:AcrR family transcriptional regulator